MNKAKIESLLNQIEDSYVVGVQSDVGVTYCKSSDVSDIEGDEDNEVLRLAWEDDMGQEFSMTFTERGLDEARISNGTITLSDSEGEPTQINLYTLEPYPILTVW